MAKRIAGTRSGTGRKPKAPAKSAERGQAAKGLDARALVRKAYKRVQARLESEEGNGKAIDELVKLAKLEKDLGEENQDVKEIKVRWEPSEDESSNEG